MKKIPLTQGKFALVDDEDFDELNQLNWCAVRSSNGRTHYATRGICVNYKQTHYFIHRVLLGVTDPKIHVDHRDRNGLNNQRYNLRTCNHAQNSHNTVSRGGSSKFLGVSWCKRTGLWQAQIRNNWEAFHLGRFKTEKGAARVRDAAARKLHGEFATLNFP